MRRGPISIFDETGGGPARKSLASWYLPGLSDGLGDRLLMFDNSGGTSLELLRFKKEFTDNPAFEIALRKRVTQLERFTHPSIGRVRAVKVLADNEGLALVSDHITGRRLSEVLRDARGPGFAMELLRQLTPALVALQQQGDGVSHGLITPERIVVTPEGKLVLVEHVLGPALEALDLSPGRLRNEFGLALPASDLVQGVNGRGDVVQLGLIALSLVLGRRVDVRDYPHKIANLLDEFPRVAGHGSSSVPPLRMWLEQALQLGARTFGSAEAAHAALMGIPDDAMPTRRDPRRTLFFRPAEPPPFAAASRSTPPPTAAPARSERQPDMPAVKWPQTKDKSAGSQTIYEQVLGRTPTAAPAPQPVADEEGVGPFEIGGQVRLWPIQRVPKSAGTGGRFRIHWFTAAVLAIAVAEGLFIAGLLYARPAGGSGTVMIETTQPGVEVLVDGLPVGATPYKLEVGSGVRSIQVMGADSRIASALLNGPVTTVRPKPETRPAAIPPPAGGSLGGLRVASGIDLQVFEEGRLIGTTAGTLALSAGRHILDVVNDKVGYRSKQTVDVRPGQTTTVTITPPNGRISINAVPWAEVWIGGTLVGDTPLANVSLPLGDHEIIFRHPQLGERRQTATVRADTMARVTATLQK
jgi:PEGA domain